MNAHHSARRAVHAAPLALALVCVSSSSVCAQALPHGDSGLLTVYDTPAAYLAAVQTLGEERHEDFEGGFTQFLPLMEFSACAEPVDSGSNDACFAPGDLVEGIHLRSSRQWGVIAFNTGIFGLPDRSVAAWPYRVSPVPTLDFTIVEFDQPPTAVAADVYGLKLENGSANGQTVAVQVDALDADGSLIGSFIVQPASTDVPAFAGFTSPVPVASVVYGTRVEIAAAPIDNLRFSGGAGVAQADAAIDFGAVALFDSAIRSWQVTNAGHLDLQFGPVPAPAAPFSIESDDCSGATLAPAASCSVQFAFTPIWQDVFSHVLEFPIVSATEPLIVQLGGGGVMGTSAVAGVRVAGGGR
jgi:hypothetical protein